MSRKRLGIVVASVILAVVAGTLAARWPFRHAQPAPPPPSEQAALTIEPHHLDFGEVWAAEKFQWDIPIRNTRQQEVLLKTVSGDCTCVSVGDFPPRLAPGEAGVIPLILDLTQLEDTAAGQSRNHQTNLTISSSIEGTDRQQTLVLRGTVKTALRPEAATVQLGIQSTRLGAIQRTVKLSAAKGIEKIDLVGGSNWTGVLARTPGSANEFVLQLRALTPLAPRVVSDVIQLKPYDAAGRELPTRSLSVKGEFVHDVLPAPRAMYLGAGTVGHSAEEEICLRSLTDGEFRVSGVNTSSPEVDVTAAAPPSGPGLGVKYAVRLRARREGEHQSSVSFRIEEPGGTSYSVVVPICYSGVALSATSER